MKPRLVPALLATALGLATLGAPHARAQVGLASSGGLGAPVPNATPAPTPQYGPNLVTNPGFETGSFSGYTTTAAAAGSEFDVDNYDPHNGTYDARFAAYGNQPDTISQTLKTVPGTTYTVSFWLLNYPGNADNAFTAQFGGTTVYSETNAAASNYTEHSANVVATGSSTVLSLAGYNVYSTDFLDDLSVNAIVPEPGTWAGGALLVGAAGLALRRRRAVR